MKAKTYMSTDWLEVHDKDSVYAAKVFLTGEDEGCMVTQQDDKKRFFNVDANLLKLGELGFLENVMKNSVELP